MNVDDIPMGEYCRHMIRSLSWWYVTFMTMFIIDVNIAVFCGIWQKNNSKDQVGTNRSLSSFTSEVKGRLYYVSSIWS